MTPFLDTLFMAGVFVASCLEINRLYRHSWISCLSFAAVAGGSLGFMAGYWWHKPVATYGYLILMHGGMFGLSMMLSFHNLRRLIAPEPLTTFHREIIHLASIATEADLPHLRKAAQAALSQEGVERRQVCRDFPNDRRVHARNA